MICRYCGAPLEGGSTYCSCCNRSNAAVQTVVSVESLGAIGQEEKGSVKVGKGLGIASFVMAVVAFLGGLGTFYTALLGTGITCFGTIFSACGCICSGVCCGLPGGIATILLAMGAILFAIVSLIMAGKKRKLFSLLGIVISLLSLLAVALSIVIALVPELVHSVLYWYYMLSYQVEEAYASSGFVAGSL